MNCHQNTVPPLTSFFMKTRKFLFAMIMGIGFLFLETPAQAQEEFIAPPTQLLTSFSFRQLTGGIILAKAQLSNFPDTLNFIFDTGSGGISLDSATCLRFNIQTQVSDKTIRGIAGIRKVKFAYGQSLRLPGLSVDS